MNAENLAYLQDKLKYLGFGDNAPINLELEEQVLRGEKEFQLYAEALYEDCRMEARLHFIKSSEKDIYFFKKYEALLHYGDGKREDRVQTFYIYKKYGFTFKEAFNLLEGRAVYKKLVHSKNESEYPAWSQLDFAEKTISGNFKITEYKDSYGYDLEKVLHLYPIIELQNDDLKTALIKSLQKGNIHPVHFVKNNKKEKVFIEASPRNKLITIYLQATRAAGRIDYPPYDEGQRSATLLPASETESMVAEEPGVSPLGDESAEQPDPSPGQTARRRKYK